MFSSFAVEVFIGNCSSFTIAIVSAEIIQFGHVSDVGNIAVGVTPLRAKRLRLKRIYVMFAGLRRALVNKSLAS